MAISREAGDSKCDGTFFSPLLYSCGGERVKFVINFEQYHIYFLVLHFSVFRWKLFNHFILHLHSQQITDCSRAASKLDSQLINTETISPVETIILIKALKKVNKGR